MSSELIDEEAKLDALLDAAIAEWKKQNTIASPEAFTNEVMAKVRILMNGGAVTLRSGAVIRLDEKRLSAHRTDNGQP